MVTTIGHMAVQSRQVLVFVMVMRPRRCGLRVSDSVPPGPRERNRVARTLATPASGVWSRLGAFGGRDFETGDASVAQLESVRQIHGASGEVPSRWVYTSWRCRPSISGRSTARRTSTVYS